MISIYKKCPNEDCGTTMLTKEQSCSKCNTSYCEPQTDTMVSFEEFSEPPEFCSDCIKTKGFKITVACITFILIVATSAILGAHELRWYIFWVFWGVWITLTGLILSGSLMYIKSYCTKNTNYYKNNETLFKFATYFSISSVAILIIIATMPSNFVWVDTVWEFEWWLVTLSG